MKKVDHSRMGVMLNLESGKVYDIIWYNSYGAKPQRCLIQGKTVHSVHSESYFIAVPNTHSYDSCNDMGQYIWDKGYCYWVADTGLRPSCSHHCIVYCQKVSDEDAEIFISVTEFNPNSMISFNINLDSFSRIPRLESYRLLVRYEIALSKTSILFTKSVSSSDSVFFEIS